MKAVTGIKTSSIIIVLHFSRPMRREDTALSFGAGRNAEPVMAISILAESAVIGFLEMRMKVWMIEVMVAFLCPAAAVLTIARGPESVNRTNGRLLRRTADSSRETARISRGPRWRRIGIDPGEW
jgi:hypothetical protein